MNCVHFSYRWGEKNSILRQEYILIFQVSLKIETKVTYLEQVRHTFFKTRDTMHQPRHIGFSLPGSHVSTPPIADIVVCDDTIRWIWFTPDQTDRRGVCRLDVDIQRNCGRC